MEDLTGRHQWIADHILPWEAEVRRRLGRVVVSCELTLISVFGLGCFAVVVRLLIRSAHPVRERGHDEQPHPSATTRSPALSTL